MTRIARGGPRGRWRRESAPDASLVAGVCLVLFFTGLGGVPFYTRGEPREALVAREMLHTGEWLVPSRPDGELTRKPPLFYWIAASALTLFPDRPELAARLPSAILGTVGVLVTWAAVRASFGAEVALPAALILADDASNGRARRPSPASTWRLPRGSPSSSARGWWRSRDERRSRAALLAIATAGAAIATLVEGPRGGHPARARRGRR